MKNRKWDIKLSEEATKKVDSLPEEVYEELVKVIKGFKTGKLNPEKMGQPVDWIKLNKKLICPECDSREVEWLLDKNSDEVTFHCLKCSESFWMTHEEYKNAIKRNPNKIIR
jgi:hypothetical protein